MIERHEYLGHQIVLSVQAASPTHYRWSWRIDGIHMAKGHRAKSEAQARDEALFLARQLLNQWNGRRLAADADLYERHVEATRQRWMPPALAA